MKRILCILSMLVFCHYSFAQGFPTTKWEDNTDETWYDASLDTFEINTAEELAGLASLVNAGNDFSGKTILLTQSIDLSQHLWTPIGQTTSLPFSGTFDGVNYEVSNVKINSAAQNIIGFFGHCIGSTIQNVVVKDAHIIGKDTVGGVVANLSTNSLMTNCHSKNIQIQGDATVGGLVGGLLTDSNITKSSSEGSVSGVQQIGGLVGTAWNKSEISESYSLGSVQANNIAGGLVGYCTMSFAPNTINVVKNCYSRASATATGDSAGALYGTAQFNGAIYNSYGTGQVSASTNAGGLVGMIQNGTVEYGYYDIETTGQSIGIGDAGMTPDQISIEGKTTSEMKTQAMVDLLNTNQTNIWTIDPNVNDGYPILANLTYVMSTDEVKTGTLSVEVAPTMVQESFTIYNDKKLKINYEIYDRSGRLLKRSEMTPDSKIVVNVQDFHSGVYIVKVQSPDQFKTVRLVKK
ncbi:MAG: hypothetical protein CSA38_02195 [Flavobacteriales bacterium]|nr:MAG: hypothetical protein CSA38_02195 [Flavobacteriales bacterium]